MARVKDAKTQQQPVGSSASSGTMTPGVAGAAVRPGARAPDGHPGAPHPGHLQATLAGLADPTGLLEGLFLHSPVPYSIFGSDGRCVLINPAYREMFGAEPPAAYNVFQDEVAEQQGISALLRRAFEGETVETPVFWYDPRELRHVQVTVARRVAISCTCFPLKGPGGDVRHVVIAYKDVTGEWTIRDEEKDRMQRALEAGGLGHWQLDLQTMAITASQGCKLHFGLPPDADLSSYERLRSLIHPEDRPSMEEAVQRSVSLCEDYAAEYRVLTPEGQVRCVVARGRVVCGEDGTPVEMMGVTVDITELKKAQKEREHLTGALAKERARLRALADTSTALAQASTDFSAALEELARLASETLGECCVLTLLHPDRQELEVVAAYHPEPEARQLLKAMVNGTYNNERGPAAHVLRTGQPILQLEVPQEEMIQGLPPEAGLFVQRYGVRSALLVPLRAQGRVIGTMGVSRGCPGWPYTLEDQGFLQEMADRAGLVIQNVRLLRTAQEAVRLRDDFLSIASHELKTPLTPLSLKLQAMARAAGSEQGGELARRLSRDVDAMRRQVKRLTDLINDLLDVARISGGRLKLELELVELAGLVREVASRFEPEAEKTGGKLHVSAGGPLAGRWDRLRLEQVVTNLLSNALKYGPGKPIHVRVEAEGEQARLTVRDEGIGIEPEHLVRIFAKFERAVSERHYGGLGLGLYITQQIVKALGGSIGVKSEPLQGALFTVLLPLRGP